MEEVEVVVPERAAEGEAPVEEEGAHYSGNAYVQHVKPSFPIPVECPVFRSIAPIVALR